MFLFDYGWEALPFILSAVRQWNSSAWLPSILSDVYMHWQKHWDA